jgi:diacylglycerol kinase (ATP)
MKKNKKEYKFIYNPHAGEKRKMIPGTYSATLEEVKALLKKYQIEVDYVPTKFPGHATKLAEEAIKEGYHTVLIAGGDGSVSEAANGLVGSKVTLGIIPMGTAMNIAKMLSVPTEIEKAIELIKIGRKRKIDAGMITKLEDEKLDKPDYFFETVGIGLDALIQKEFKNFEDGDLLSIIKIIKIFINFYTKKVILQTDDDEIITKATIITIANGPLTGANLLLAPDAKLNDHRLTITLYPMSKFDLLKYFLRMKAEGKIDKRKLKTIQTKKVTVTSKHPVTLHADATVFSKTPAVIKIVPNAVTFICGFPDVDDIALKSRTELDP